MPGPALGTEGTKTLCPRGTHIDSYLNLLDLCSNLDSDLGKITEPL